MHARAVYFSATCDAHVQHEIEQARLRASERDTNRIVRTLGARVSITR